MIDWNATKLKFGYRNSDDLGGIKRPKVVCRCDECNKTRDITIRVKSKISNDQMSWVCPSCVCLKRSDTISQQMKKQWCNREYRDHQITHKHQSDYKRKQQILSIGRWLDPEYREQLETGIDVQKYLHKCRELYGDKAMLLNLI